MMATYYPVFLDINAKPCVVIGGGEIAQRKICNLLASGARVTVISPEVTSDILHKVNLGQLTWIPRKYSSGDLKGAFLAISATDDMKVSEDISREASDENVLLNVVDVPSLCVFIAPAIIRRGDVTIALSTNGTSPALARKIRETLEMSEALEYAELSGILHEARADFKQRNVVVDPLTWQQNITADLIALVKAGKSKEALERLKAGLGKGSPAKITQSNTHRTG